MLRGQQLLAIPVPVKVSAQDVVQAHHPDGVIFSGGNTLSAISPNELSELRDNYERALLEICLEKQVPVFAVCRGAQFLASYFGGEIREHDGHVAQRHLIEFGDAIKHLKSPELPETVNSFHNHSIHTIEAPLSPLAHAHDGTVEAFAHNTLPIIGVMWHPEREAELTPLDAAILRYLF